MHSTRKRRPAANPAAISGQLREIIAGRGLAAYAVAQAAGVSPSVVSRFLSRERGLTLETFDAIAAGLGLRLVETGRGRGRPSKPGPVREVTKKVDGSPGGRAELDPDPDRTAREVADGEASGEDGGVALDGNRPEPADHDDPA